MTSLKRGRQRSISQVVQVGLAGSWMVASAGLAQTPAAQNAVSPTPGVAQVVQQPSAPSAPAAVPSVAKPSINLPQTAPTQRAQIPAVPAVAAATPGQSTQRTPAVVPVASGAQPAAVVTLGRGSASTITRSNARAAAQRNTLSAPVQIPIPPAAAVPAVVPDPPPPYPVAARATPPPAQVAPPDLPSPALTPVAPLNKAGKRTMLQKLVPANTNVATTSLNSYVERLHRETSAAQPLQGSIWTESGRLTRLNTDVRAMRPNDLIQVVVLENLAASTDGTVKNQRASTANSSISGLLGTLHANNALQNLITQSSGNSLNAAGASATNSSLSTTFGGQVIEVLPNGMLVIEAARQVEFSQQTQTIILRGLVRPEDISQENQVISTAISSLELEVKGKGIVNDYTRRQNALVRLIQQILVF